MSASPTIADYVGKTFVAFSEAPQSTHGHPSPAVLEGLRVLDSKDGPILESVVAFSTESPTPSPMISRQVHLQDIIAPVPNAAAGWRIIDEAQAQSDDTFKERNTVSSLLSRFKSEGVVSYDGTVYRLKKFGEPTKDAQEAPAVH